MSKERSDADLVEIWKPVLGFEDYYSVSNTGRVMSFCRPTPRLLKPWITAHGYKVVRLWKSYRYRTVPIHLLVLEAFVGPRPQPSYHGCHNDGDPLNNTLNNLRWDTASGNMQDKKKHGRAMFGQGHARAKLSDEDVATIRRMISAGCPQTELARMYSVSKGLIGHIKKRRLWKHI